MSETVYRELDSGSHAPTSRRAFLGFALGSAACTAAIAPPLKDSGAKEPIDKPPGSIAFGDTFGVLIRLDFQDQAEDDSSTQDILYWLPISLKNEVVDGHRRRRHEVIIEQSGIVPRRLKKRELTNNNHEPPITPKSTIEALDKLPTYFGVKQALAGYFIDEGGEVQVRSGKVAPIVDWAGLDRFSP